jgi:hypothetical protein
VDGRGAELQSAQPRAVHGMLSRDNTSGKTVRRNVSSVSGQNAAEFHINSLAERLALPWVAPAQPDRIRSQVRRQDGPSGQRAENALFRRRRRATRQATHRAPAGDGEGS